MTVQPIRMWPGAAPDSLRRAVRQERTEPGVIVAFPRDPNAANRFCLRDRAELLAWTEQARAFGICRVVLERADPQDAPGEVGDFALIYDESSEWARWAVAPEQGRYLAWSPNSGQTIGYFPNLGEALAAIHAPGC